jgi:hypothetical protein
MPQEKAGPAVSLAERVHDNLEINAFLILRNGNITVMKNE